MDNIKLSKEERIVLLRMHKLLYGTVAFLAVLFAITVFKHRGDEILETSLNTADEKDISSIYYKKDGVVARYPSFVSGGTTKEISVWNNLISEDFKRILDIYSFQPFPELTPAPADSVPTILNINYEITENNSFIFSVLYRAAFHTSYSAYPTELIYTTNINKVNSTKLQLKNVVKLDKEFVKDFRTWDFTVFENDNEELRKAVKDYVANLTDEELLRGFLQADQINSKNSLGIFSYFKPNSLGISLSAPHYIGDHIEFEREYSKLANFLKPEFKVPKGK
ncbi:MAG: hypothetical protein QM644_20295 [Mobilitalea sp.]